MRTIKTYFKRAPFYNAFTATNPTGEPITSGLLVIQEFLRPIHTSRLTPITTGSLCPARDSVPYANSAGTAINPGIEWCVLALTTREEEDARGDGPKQTTVRRSLKAVPQLVELQAIGPRKPCRWCLRFLDRILVYGVPQGRERMA
jgi:hypothetical protein